MAPYSGHMFDSVARSAIDRDESPSPKNSTNFPTTPWARNISVSVSTRSVAVVPAGSSPMVRTPITIGCGRNIGWPSIAASASIPPTPREHAEAVDHRGVRVGADERVGKATPSRVETTWPRCSRFTW